MKRKITDKEVRSILLHHFGADEGHNVYQMNGTFYIEEDLPTKTPNLEEGWIMWDGGLYPPRSICKFVEVIFRDGTFNELPHSAAKYNWSRGHDEEADDIVAYRVVDSDDADKDGL